MDYQSRDALALFNKSRHEIRGMQVVSDDFVPFQKDRKLKITGTALNAVGALIQQVNEEAGNSDFAIFSTLLSPLISKQLPQNKMYGTIIGHIQAACQGAPMDILLAKSRWLFPMYGSAPPHWVLGWIEPGPRLFHIFDSMPELNSVSWAEPALLELGDTVYATLGRMEVDWEPWKRVLHSPDELDRQMNDWACGLFVIHAMKSLADGIGIKGVKNGETERVRESTLKLVLDNLCRFRLPETEVQMQDNIKMTQGTNQFIDDARMDIDLPEPSNIQSEHIAIVESANATILDTSSSKRKIEETADNGSVESARQTSIATSSGIEISTHENPRQAKKARKAYTKISDREKALRSNEWITEVEPHRARCKGCARWIKLDQRADQPFKTENWNRHENKCPQITGLDRTRTAVKKPVKVVTGKASIASFFGNLQKPEPKPVPEPVSEPSSLKGNDASDSESDSGRISNVTYTTLLVNATPSVATFFAPGPITSHPRVREASPEPPERRSCQHLSGGDYIEYIERTETRTMGGISPKLRGRIIRQIFMYKKIRALKHDDDTPAQRTKCRKDVEKDIPVDGNDCLASADWTEAEHVRLSEVLKGHARWEVNYVRKFVCSPQCEGLTSNVNGICDTCKKLSKDDSLRHAVNRKKREAQLPEEEQHEILMARNKYSSRRFLDDEARNLNDQLKDPLTFKAFKLLQKGESTECFFQLYEACLNGKLKKYETFQQLCGVLADGLEREGTNKRFGVRYPKDYLNFMILLRSYGGQSSRQYGIIAGQFPAPSSRHLRSLVAKSEDALTNPYLVYENMARVRRLINTLNYTGPVAVAGDCTKVRSRLTYCHDYGGHILGSVLPFEETIVEDPKEIDAVIAKITKAKAQASQVRAILVKVPLPQVPPQVVALIPTDGKDDAPKIMEQNLKLLQMAAQLDLKVISFAADGAASELAAQTMFENLKTDFLPLTYEYVLFGIRLRTPVFETGPAVAVTDAPHSSKTGRNQPQHGTHTASMGLGKLVNNDLVRLQRIAAAGLLKSDVVNVDKQDDGPARRLWHHMALQACTIEDERGMKIQPGFEGLFVYLFVFGVLFDAWLNRTMSVANRVLAVLRARFWLHFWRAHIVQMTAAYPDLYSPARSFISPASFHIFNRLCDSLLLLVIIYARHYPDQPFCPWLLGTEFVEHFFGLARMLLPNFTYAEFLKMVQHMMVRQRILLSGRFKEKRERNAGVGYVLDFDSSALTPEERNLAQVALTDSDINALVELAFKEAALICTQLMRIPAPKPTREKPVILTPLGAPMRTGKQAAHDDSDSEFDPDEEEDDEEVLEPPAGEATESRAVALAAHDAARYSALCEDFDAAVEEAQSDPVIFGPPPLTSPSLPTTQSLTAPVIRRSEIIDGDGKLSIALMVRARLHWQSGTTTRSQKTFRIDSKYALSRISKGAGTGDDDTEPEKMTHQEASQRVRIAQDSNTDVQDSKPRKTRELRWKEAAAALQKLVNTNILPNISAKNVHALNLLSIGSFSLMWNGTRFYIGEILDVYKKGASSRYGSIEDSPTASGLSYLSLRVYLPLGNGSTAPDSDDLDDDLDADEIPAPLFSCYDKSAHIYTHAKVEHLIFHLGPNIFEASRGGLYQTLTKHAALRWNMLTRKESVVKEIRKVILKVKKP